MLFSVIVPIYKIEKYLRRCIDSVLGQTFSDFELILVNDGSPDNCPAICEEYAAKDKRIRVIHKENGGVTSARLRGVVEATGEWIGFVDGDDYVEPQMYERLLDNALKYQADISHCGHQLVFPDGRVEYVHKSENLFIQDHPTKIIMHWLV